ncbi:hypothetical protein [Leifsonia poae]|uniref:hypothetical protein n=1 Tax=Leifsonia poae TaxID=110933 RepID=UPI003D6721A2
MGHAQPLPPSLRDAPFATHRALAIGVAPGRLRAREVEHPFHGVNTARAPAGLLERCAAYVERMLDDQVFSHVTAAALYGMPLPRGAVDGPLHVSVPFPRTPPRSRGVRGHSVRDIDVREVSGLRVCSPLQVWLQLAAILPREELVVTADHIVGARGRDALASLSELRRVALALGSVKGVASARWAADQTRWGADSRPETLLRLALVDYGFPEPRVNPAISLPDGRVVHPDLVFADERVILEYEGDGHRTDADQWMYDIRRHDDMVVARWRVIRVTRRDLFVARDAFMRRLVPVIRPGPRPGPRPGLGPGLGRGSGPVSRPWTVARVP